MLELLPLALAAAVYPSLLAAVVLIMAQPNPRRLLGAYLAGSMTASVSAGAAIVFGLSSSSLLEGSEEHFGPGLDVAIGLLALLMFWVLLTDRDRRLRERRQRRREHLAEAGRDPWSRRILSRGSLWLTFLLGIALSLPGALYLVALKDIAEAESSAAVALWRIVFFNLVMFALAEVPLVGYAVAPDRTQAAVAAANAWLGDHSRHVAMALCAAAAAYLLGRGLLALAL